MSFIEQNLQEFTGELASKAAVPGGGGGAALAGAIGMALGSMVGNLTVGKPRYASVEDDVKAILAEAEEIRLKMLSLIDGDAEVFAPVAKAYSLPKGPERDEVMEAALKGACSVPMEIMKQACRSIELHDELSQKSNAAISDIGVGVVCCRAALLGASLNVFINTKSMLDKEYAKGLEQEADSMLEKYTVLADKIYANVQSRVR